MQQSQKKRPMDSTLSLESQTKLSVVTTIVALVAILLQTNLVILGTEAAPSMAVAKASLGEDANFAPLEQSDIVDHQMKRAAIKYNFGLGKRSESLDNTIDSEPSYNLHQDPDDNIPINEVQSDPARYVYYLPDKRERSQKFSFGLGKRVQKFSFGLGKRSSGPVDGEQEMYNDSDIDFDAKEKRTRPKQYAFGLGKRSWFNNVGRDGKKKVANFDEFMKRRYSFGLGKRSV